MKRSSSLISFFSSSSRRRPFTVSYSSCQLSSSDSSLAAVRLVKGADIYAIVLCYCGNRKRRERVGITAFCTLSLYDAVTPTLARACSASLWQEEGSVVAFTHFLLHISGCMFHVLNASTALVFGCCARAKTRLAYHSSTSVTRTGFLAGFSFFLYISHLFLRPQTCFSSTLMMTRAS